MRGHRPGLRLAGARFLHGTLCNVTAWRLMLSVLTSTFVPPIGMPGPGKRGNGRINCPHCRQRALEQEDGSYKCKNGHRFFPDDVIAEEENGQS
jgi:hypothetical protein